MCGLARLPWRRLSLARSVFLTARVVGFLLAPQAQITHPGLQFMQHTIPEAASPGTPLWLRHWPEGGAEGAAAALSAQGHVVVLASLFSENLPPPLTQEKEEAATAADPRGYLIRRGIARAIAALAAQVPAGSLVVARGEHGAPRLIGCPLHVSFSARGTLGAIAIGVSPLGVDYEAELPPAGIPWNMLSEDEKAQLVPLAPAARIAAFLTLWRAKEAALKALGLGFTCPPEAVHIHKDHALIAGQDRKIALCPAESARITLALA